MTPATPARTDPPPVTVWPPARRAVAALAVLTALLVVVVGALVGGAAADPWVRIATVAHLVAAAWAVTDARAVAVQVAAGVAACWALLVGADGTVVAVVVLVAGVVVTAELLGASHRLGMVVERDPRPEAVRVAIAGALALATSALSLASSALPGPGGAVATGLALVALGLLAVAVRVLSRPD